MEVKRIKQDKECHQCHTVINQGDAVVSVNFKAGDGYWLWWFFHKNCYIEYISLLIQRKEGELMRKESTPVSIVKTLGRPRRKREKSGRKLKVHLQFRQMRRRLLSLKIYHQKANNPDRVLEIECQIKELEGLL